MASPFVQGHLWNEPLSVTIATACAHCDRPMRFEIDSALRVRLLDAPAGPLVFAPLVDFSRWTDPSIIDGF